MQLSERKRNDLKIKNEKMVYRLFGWGPSLEELFAFQGKNRYVNPMV